MKITPNFPALTGSEKQVRWAEELRQKVFGIISHGVIEPGLARIRDGMNVERATTMVTAAVEAFETAPIDAKWWIENRHGMNLSEYFMSRVKAAVKGEKTA